MPGTLSDAVAADGMRKKQKKEGTPIIQMLPDAKLTFQQLTDWHMSQESVKAKKSAWRDGSDLKNFNKVFGDTHVTQITLADLENYQARRESEGRSS